MWQAGKYRIEPLRFMLILAVTLEIGLLTFIHKIAGSQGSPVLLFLASLTVAILPVILLKKHSEITTAENSSTLSSIKGNSLFYAMAAIVGIWFYTIIQQYPLDAKLADIVPTIELMVTRFLNGTNPYEVITDFGQQMVPGYISMQWLPYVIPELAGMDYRLFSYLIFVACLIPYKNYVLKQAYTSGETIIKLVLPFILLACIFIWKPDSIAWTVELMAVGFYALLAWATLHHHIGWLGFALILCVLSRFSLLFWIPYLFIFIRIKDGFKRVFKLGLLVLAGILLLYILPFLSQDWDSFSNGLTYYTTAAKTEWSGQAWQKPGDQPYQLSNGVGFATYFYNLLGGSIDSRIALIKQWHLVMSVLAILAWGLLHHFRLKNYNPRFVMLLGLKFYFVFFYSFIQVPYIYLFFVPTIISLVILANVPLKGMVVKSAE